MYEGHGRGAELAAAKGTAWGLLSAVTEFVDHERRARSQEYRLDSAWFGQGNAQQRHWSMPCNWFPEWRCGGRFGIDLLSPHLHTSPGALDGCWGFLLWGSFICFLENFDGLSIGTSFTPFAPFTGQAVQP